MHQRKPDQEASLAQREAGVDRFHVDLFTGRAENMEVVEEIVAPPPQDPFDRSSNKVNPLQVEAAKLALAKALERSSALTDTTKFKGEKYEQTGTTWSLRIG
jgi:hypothetical protein